MRNLTLIASAAAIAAGLASPAFAQDRAPFTGPRVEAVVGYDSLDDRSGQDAGSSSGVTYGGAIGYDFQAGNFVAGIEGEATKSSADTRSANRLVAGDVQRLDADRDLYVGGRIGAALTPTTLLYAKGGYTNFKVDDRYTTATTGITDRQHLDGYRVGAGAEHMLGANTYIKAEYRFSHYEKLDVTGNNPNRHQVVAGVGLRF